MIDHLAEWVATEHELSNDDLLEKIIQMSQYIARLEAAYLATKTQLIAGFGRDGSAIEIRDSDRAAARESLERIKAGDTK